MMEGEKKGPIRTTLAAVLGMLAAPMLPPGVSREEVERRQMRDNLIGMMEYYENLISKLHPNDPHRKKLEKELMNLKDRTALPKGII